jgi:hypothetical protein
MTVLRNILSARPWWRYTPDQSVFALGAGGGKIQNAASRSADGDAILIYLSNPATVSIRMDKIAGAQVAARWVNPETGEETPAGRFPNRGVQVFSTPVGRTDVLLLLDAVRPR